MAEVSVREFSQTVGTSIERLLAQLSEAGLPQSAESDILSEQDKKKFLEHLRRSRENRSEAGESAAAAPREKLTLKRRQVREIAVAPSTREPRGSRPASPRAPTRKRTVKVSTIRSRGGGRAGGEQVSGTAKTAREQEAAKSNLVEEAHAHRRALEERMRADNEERSTEIAPRKHKKEEEQAKAEPAVEAADAAATEAVTEVDAAAEPAVETVEKKKKAKAKPAAAPRAKAVKDEDAAETTAEVPAEATGEATAEAAPAPAEATEEAAPAPVEAAVEVAPAPEPTPAPEETPAAAQAQVAAEAQAPRAPAAEPEPAKEVRPQKAASGKGAAAPAKTREPGRSEPRKGEKRGGARDERGGGRRRERGGELHVRSDRSGRRRPGLRRMFSRAVAPQTQHTFERPTGPVVREVDVPEAITVGELAHAMSVKAAEVVRELMKLGSMMTINQTLDQDTAILVVEEMGHKANAINQNALEEEIIAAAQTSDAEAVARAPVVTIMGHVDHGKTSLLDKIRATDVATGEAGGITQHIGAYHVHTERGDITFIDTPGHAAFTAMRARGSQATDIVILVVAADDGVMPQTEEAIDHARAANVPIIVAVNKIDREDAQPERVMQELSGKEIIPEAWGGDTIFVSVSAATGENIPDLLEAVLLQAELLELNAPARGAARGVVIESRLDRGRGPVATVLVQGGVLERGDILLAGGEFGKVRELLDEHGERIEQAGPSIPVEVLGLSAPPEAGDEAVVVPNERKAREIAAQRQFRAREHRIARQQATNLENMLSRMGQDEVKALNVVLKADVQGSAEALTESLHDLSTDEVQVKIVASGIGGIRETDANLAIASNAIIIGFNTRADSSARAIIEREGVQLFYYSVIYEVIDAVRAALSGMLAPEVREEIVGVADVREVFRVRRFGAISGCLVMEGSMQRNLPIRVLRDDVVIFEGELESLRRFKEDVNEVPAGTECGIGVRSHDDVQVGDRIEAFRRVETERTV